MKIFLSWSGSLSHEIAKALDAWLPQVINAVQPWLSSQDIEKGARWFEEIGETLSTTDFGVLCLTQTNISAPWILFEAGALSKSLGQARVCPLLINIKNADLQGPLAQFNTAGIAKDEIFRLIESINARLPEEKRRTETQLEEAFEVWWPRLENQLIKSISKSKAEEEKQPKLPKRPIEDILDEILELSRQSAQELTRNAATRPSPIHSFEFEPQMRASKYPVGSVGYFAAELNRKTDSLMAQLAEAGINKNDPNDILSDDEKLKLLEFLRSSHGVLDPQRKKITLIKRNR